MNQHPYWWREEYLPGRREARTDQTRNRPYWWGEDYLPELPERSGYLDERRYGYQGAPRPARPIDRDDDLHYDERRRGWTAKASDDVKAWLGNDRAARRRARDRAYADEHRRDYRAHGPHAQVDEDEELRDMICARLDDEPGLDASEVVVRVLDNEAILDGAARNGRDADRIVRIAEDVPGIVHVRDRLERYRSSEDRMRRAIIGMGYDETPAERRRWRS